MTIPRIPWYRKRLSRTKIIITVQKEKKSTRANPRRKRTKQQSFYKAYSDRAYYLQIKKI
jgi:hypothetical protein